MSHLANEFDAQSEFHGQVSLAAVNQILCRSWGYEGLQNSKDSLKACFENVNIVKWTKVHSNHEVHFCLNLLAHLSRRLMGELIVYQSLRPSVRPSVSPSVRQHFQTSSPLKPPGQLKANFIWRLLRTRERNFVQMVLVTWPRWPPRPYMVKTL